MRLFRNAGESAMMMRLIIVVGGILLGTACAQGQTPTSVLVGGATGSANTHTYEPFAAFASAVCQQAGCASSGAAAATSTTSGVVPNLGGNSGAAATDSTGHLASGELPTNALTTASEGVQGGLAQLDSSAHLVAAQLPTNALTTALEGTAVGQIPVLGTGGLLGCGLFPLGSGLSCSGGQLVATGTAASTATSTTSGVVPNLGGNSGAAATDSTGRLVAGELPTNALTTSTLIALSQPRTLANGAPIASITIPASGTAPSGVTAISSLTTVATTCSSAASGSTAAPLQLPAGAASGSYTATVLNRGSGPCAVYPPSGGTIENNGANVPQMIAAGQGFDFISTSSSAWDVKQ